MTFANTVGIIGAGPAGLVTAQVLLQDGFEVEVLTEDSSPGGVWARHRVYPSLKINNLHGEFCFSSLPMPPPQDFARTGGRLSGEDLCSYMEAFAEKFLQGKIRFGAEVLNVRRSTSTGVWNISIRDKSSGQESILEYARVVLCTGGCNTPSIPKALSQSAADVAGFQGLVIHSRDFAENLEEMLVRTEPDDGRTKHIVVVGGGKSAQDASSHLANEGRNVSVVFNKVDGPMANKKPLPNYIRRSRLLSILSPHIELRSRLERFLHTTWLGGKITHYFWNDMSASSFDVLQLPIGSPLRSAHSLFWNVHTTDEGSYQPDSFFAAVNRGAIKLYPSSHVQGYGTDGSSVVLSTGQTLPADVVILCTGYASSWGRLFDAETAEELGINKQRLPPREKDAWGNFVTLKEPPTVQDPNAEQLATTIYRGIVPAKNIERRDFAVNGAVYTSNAGYTYEVSAHWISSYFLHDQMKLPSSAEEALANGVYYAMWLRKRFPGVASHINESFGGAVCLWDWCQHVDTLLMDMHLPYMRSGGNWLTWPFKVVEQSEIQGLSEERRAKRASKSLA